MRRLCWLLLLFLVTAPLAAHADGFALAKQGFQAQKQGQWDEAIRLYSAALEAGDLDDKSRLLVMGLRGNALGIRGRYDEAVQAFDAAIRRDPSSPLPMSVGGWSICRWARPTSPSPMTRRR